MASVRCTRKGTCFRANQSCCKHSSGVNRSCSFTLSKFLNKSLAGSLIWDQTGSENWKIKKKYKLKKIEKCNNRKVWKVSCPGNGWIVLAWVHCVFYVNLFQKSMNIPSQPNPDRTRQKKLKSITVNWLAQICRNTSSGRPTKGNFPERNKYNSTPTPHMSAAFP